MINLHTMGHFQALLLFGCSGIEGYHRHHRRLRRHHHHHANVTMQSDKSVMPVLKRRNSGLVRHDYRKSSSSRTAKVHRRNFSYSRLVRIQEPATARGPEQQSAHTFTAVVTRKGASSQPQNTARS
jgi:hypothetical protein